MEPPIRHTLKEDKPLNKDSLKINTKLILLSAKDERMGPKCVHYSEVPL